MCHLVLLQICGLVTVSKFFQTGKEEDLGDITKTRTCSYCLYWNVGPGSENTQCQCDGLFMKLTNNGNKYNLDIHK